MRWRISRVALIALALVAVLALPHLVDSRYYMRLINVAGIFIILVAGYNMVYGLTGQLSFGHAGFFGIGAYSVGIATVQMGLSPWVGLVAAIVLTTIAGIIVGVPTLRVRGHYLALATIAFGEIVHQVLLNWQSVTGGYDGILGIGAPALGPLTFQGDRSIYYLILLFVFLLIVVADRIKQSTYGRAMFAVNDSELAAEIMGVNATYTKVLAFAVSAFYAGIAGALYSFLYGYISPDAFDFHVSITIVAMLLVGGAGSTAGAAVGAIALTFLPEVLRISEEYYMVLYGIIFLAILVFLPQGIAGFLASFVRRVMRRFSGSRDEPVLPAEGDPKQSEDDQHHERETSRSL